MQLYIEATFSFFPPLNGAKKQTQIRLSVSCHYFPFLVERKTYLQLSTFLYCLILNDSFPLFSDRGIIIFFLVVFTSLRAYMKIDLLFFRQEGYFLLSFVLQCLCFPEKHFFFFFSETKRKKINTPGFDSVNPKIKSVLLSYQVIR